MVLSDGIDWPKFVDAGVIHKDVETSERLARLGKQSRHVIRLSHVRLDRDGPPAARPDVRDQTIRDVPVRGVVDDDGRALVDERLRNAGADPFAMLP